MTRPLILSLAAMLAGGSALAGPAAAPQTLPPVQITAPAPLPAHELRLLTGQYALSDGRVLRVEHGGRILTAAFGKRRAHALDNVGGHRFATRDGRTTIEFLPSASGHVEHLRMTQLRPVAAAGDATLGE